jgi:hypothetical protein
MDGTVANNTPISTVSDIDHFPSGVELVVVPPLCL